MGAIVPRSGLHQFARAIAHSDYLPRSRTLHFTRHEHPSQGRFVP